MAGNNITRIPEMPASIPVVFNGDKCIGCNKCIEICQVDVFIPNPFKEKKIPVVLYPGECWYCGCCVMVCPAKGAIELRHPLMNRVRWVEKSKLPE